MKESLWNITVVISPTNNAGTCVNEKRLVQMALVTNEGPEEHTSSQPQYNGLYVSYFNLIRYKLQRSSLKRPFLIKEAQSFKVA